MNYSTTNTYTMKREILTFSNRFSKGLTKPKKKFVADMTYGMLASNSCLLSDIADTLHEDIKKKNTIERLSLNLANGTPNLLLSNYLDYIKRWVPDEPVIHIDDSDVIKPEGYKFESLGMVRDGSESSSSKNIYKKGYHVTEACVMASNGHPVSIFSQLHSSNEKGYKSINSITFSAMQRGVNLFKKATFVMDRGYDDNKMFLKLDKLKQDYVIRLTKKRKLFLHNKWVSATELCNRRKGKIKAKFFYKGKDHVAYLSHVKVQVTASRKNVNLVLIYGITESPMMLLTNKEIKSKDDVIKIAKLYFSRWKIEEYFRAKKQIFQFENFRVRSLKAINALNMLITFCMAFLAHISMKRENSTLKAKIIEIANPLKETVHFLYYRIAKGILGILAYAREGVKLWYKTKRPRYHQLCFKIAA
jgi:hypothetical protein